VSNFDRPSIINVNLAIAKAARVLNVQTAWRRSRRRAYRLPVGDCLCGHAPPL